MCFCHQQRSLKRLYAFLVFSILVSAPENALPQDERQPALTTADRVVLSTIFDDRHVADNALAVHQRASRMSVEERYEYLSTWVLPGSDHVTIRTSLDFTPTNPAPPVRGEEQLDVGRLRIAERSAHSRVQIGGRLVAPALDLVEVASQLGRLEEVRDRVDRVTPTNDVQRRSRLALLVAVDTAREDFDAALGSLERLFTLVEAGEHSSFSERWPETLAIWTALRHPETRDRARDMLFHIVHRQVRLNIRSGAPTWRVHIQAMWGRANYFHHKMGDESGQSFGMAPVLKQWSATNRVIAISRGNGSPQSHWQTGTDLVENLGIHCDDYLFFQSPLRGNFEVECDVTAHNWRQTTMYVAGRWVAPDYNLTSYRVGNVRGARPRRPLQPKLTKPRDWFRYRAVVRDNVFSTYINGRKIHDEPLPAEHEPWLAIRSVLRNAGATRGLRITGHPVIPESVRLSALEDLPGWMPYFFGPVGSPESDWRQRGDLPSGGGIVGRHRPEFAGTGLESLLYYVRPMVENGEIEYEFYYREGESHTHPALDRLAFMLDHRGIRIHWITDGKYDRTGLDPTNITDEPQNRRGPAVLPLKPNSWNRLKLLLVGNVVQLILNGHEVYERELEATNQRTFGLFHYADRTEARVRDIVWRGDWPRELPPVKEQELAGEGTDFLDADIPKLTAVFEHDFTSDGLPEDRFVVLEPGWQPFIVEQPDGVHVTRTGVKGRYLHFSIAPRCTVKGDFDVTASFKKFEPAPSTETEMTNCSLYLSAVLNDKAQTRTYLSRRHQRRAKQDVVQLVQGSFHQIVDDQTRRDWFGAISFEAEGGTLRLARRGNKMYYLVAEEDSSYFRLIGEETLSDADLRPNGIRIMTQTAGPGTTKVVWKKMTIRATGITGLPADK